MALRHDLLRLEKRGGHGQKKNARFFSKKQFATVALAGIVLAMLAFAFWQFWEENQARVEADKEKARMAALPEGVFELKLGEQKSVGALSIFFANATGCEAGTLPKALLLTRAPFLSSLSKSWASVGSFDFSPVGRNESVEVLGFNGITDNSGLLSACSEGKLLNVTSVILRVKPDS